MKKTLVTIGCSLTKDNFQKTWADFLAESLDYDLLNLGARGAGLDFLSKRALIGLKNLSPNDCLIGILLPSSDRFDLYVDKDHVLKKELIDIASWQDGRRPSLVQIDGNMSSEHGYSLTGGERRGLKKHWYKYYYSPTMASITYWFYFICLQNYLKIQNFQYFFMSVYDINNTIEQACNQGTSQIPWSDINELIDFGPFISYKDSQGFLDYVKDRQGQIIRHHPTEENHKNFVNDLILPFLKNNNYL